MTGAGDITEASIQMSHRPFPTLSRRILHTLQGTNVHSWNYLTKCMQCLHSPRQCPHSWGNGRPDYSLPGAFVGSQGTNKYTKRKIISERGKRDGASRSGWCGRGCSCRLRGAGRPFWREDIWAEAWMTRGLVFPAPKSVAPGFFFISWNFIYHILLYITHTHGSVHIINGIILPYEL